MAAIASRIQDLRAWGDRVGPVTLRQWELARTTLDRLERAISDEEEWLILTLTDGTVLASDDFSDLGRLRPVAAVIYPELDSRLWAWWFTHAWSTLELADEAARALRGWSLASAATLTRSLLETVAAFSYEARQLGDAWRNAKKLPGGPDRPLRVRQEIGPRLLRAFRGSRMKESPDLLRPANVLTWIERLARDTHRTELLEWYDQLSDAAHPSSSARTLYASVMFMHDSGGKAETLFSYGPIGATEEQTEQSVDTRVSEFPRTISDVWVYCVDVLLHLLPLAFTLPADFSLTSKARDLVGTAYLNNMWSGPGCLCGCDGDHAHRWSGDFPPLRLSKT